MSGRTGTSSANQRAIASRDGSDAAVTATTADARDALARWFAVDVPVLAADDVEGYAALYARLA